MPDQIISEKPHTSALIPEGNDSSTFLPGRLPFVDGIRAVAALVVVLDHIYLEVFGSANSPHPPRAFDFLSSTLTLGHLSVAVFIVISGFVLTLPLLKHNMHLGPGGAWRFFARRARRILPPYYAALLLTLLLLATVLRPPTNTHLDVVKLIRPLDLVSHFLMLQNIFGSGRINYVYWSIATECHIYLLFPLLLLLWRRWGAQLTVTVSLLFGYGVQLGMGENRITRAYVHFLGLFAMGMFAAAYLVPKINQGRRGLLSILRVCGMASVAVIVVSLYLLRSQNRLLWFPYLDFPAALAAVWLLTQGCTEAGGIARLFGSRPLVQIGLFSYSLYLMHLPILAGLLYLSNRLGMQGMTQYMFLCTVGIAVMLAGTYAFFLLFERPFLKSKRAAPDKAS
jgi:peptidoglycan/LPS O-acetylase OafA/YrhL